jgi:hypothetical protein
MAERYHTSGARGALGDRAQSPVPERAVAHHAPDVCNWQIVLQKSQIVSRRFFREKTKQAAIVDGYGVKFVGEVACEFIVAR